MERLSVNDLVKVGDLLKTRHFIDIAATHRHESYDPNGYIFSWDDGIYRAIYPQSQHHVLKLFNSGLIARLIELGLFPDSKITNYKTSDCELVIEHMKIPVITYPYEWSFAMLKDAALTTLRVNKVAREYGYQTLDAHGFNISFYRGKPLFIDLGSLIEIRNEFGCKKAGWRPYGEFMRSFYAPLKLWSMGEEYFARRALYGDEMPMANYWRFKSVLLRFVPKKYLSMIEFLWYKYKALNTANQSEFLDLASVSDRREKIAATLISVSRKYGLPFSSIDFTALESRISKIKPAKLQSACSENYQDMPIDARQHFIKAFISESKPGSVLEITEKGGFLCKEIAAIEGVNHVVCADNDTTAIDQLYSSLGASHLNVIPMVFNFSQSIGDFKFPDDNTRLKSDLVVALDLTHQLILAQKLTLDFIMLRLKKLTNKYVAVEFMPMGLTKSNAGKNTRLPDWYTLDWYRAGFERTFNLVDERHIDLNHVIFIGTIKK